jgi:hypothetical protein
MSNLTQSESVGYLNIVNSIQFIYLRAWQQSDKSNYSQALKQQYRIKIIYWNLQMTSKSRINIKKQTKYNPDVEYETYRV